MNRSKNIDLGSTSALANYAQSLKQMQRINNRQMMTEQAVLPTPKAKWSIEKSQAFAKAAIADNIGQQRLEESEKLIEDLKQLAIVEDPSSVLPGGMSGGMINGGRSANHIVGHWLNLCRGQQGGDGITTCGSPEELSKRLDLLLASKQAGNDSSRLVNEAMDLNDKLYELGVIDQASHERIFNSLISS